LRSASRDVRFRAVLWPASLVTGAGARLADRVRRRPVTLTRPRSPLGLRPGGSSPVGPTTDSSR
jgi:hypothetical protein